MSQVQIFEQSNNYFLSITCSLIWRYLQIFYEAWPLFYLDGLAPTREATLLFRELDTHKWGYSFMYRACHPQVSDYSCMYRACHPQVSDYYFMYRACQPQVSEYSFMYRACHPQVSDYFFMYRARQPQLSRA